MTEQEAIDCLKADKEYLVDMKVCDGEEMDVAIKALEELEQYRAIGTPEECRAAVEKQKAKKPIHNDKCTCPSCGTHNEVIKKRRNTVYSDIVYCWHCGQAVKIFRSDEE